MTSPWDATAELQDDDRSTCALSSSESEWSDTVPRKRPRPRIGDAFQAAVTPHNEWVAEASVAWHGKRRCSTPGCALKDGHLGPHSAEATQKAKRIKPFKIPTPTNRPTVYAHAVVERRIAVFWPSEGQWYNGYVYAYDDSTDFHSVLYDDGDDNVECLCDPTTEWVLI